MKKAITIIVIILLVAGGIYGYKYYKNVYLPQQDAKYEIEETTEVIEEPVEVGQVYDNYDDSSSAEADAVYKQYLDIMEASEGSYYKVDEFQAPSTVTSLPKSDFESSIENYEECSKAGAKALEHFYNIKFRELKGGDGEEFSNDDASNILMGSAYLDEGMIRTLKSAFNGSVQDYFYDHQLKLSCKDIKIKKIGFEDCNGKNIVSKEWKDDIELFYMFIIYEAQVTTDDCKGDMSDIGIFAEKGKTKTITNKMVFVSDTALAGIYFE